ncbi:MAG: LD-carboxypeptidase [Bdellovibrionales bacterium]
MGVRALKENDIVDVVAPGFGCSLEDLEKARRYLIEKGFRPRIPESIFGQCPIHSNTDEERAQQLIQALTATDSKAVWFLRGGYGSNRLLPALKKIKKKPRPKLTIGISDVTSLHTHFIQKWGWTSLHGSLLDRLGKGIVPPEVESELLAVVRGQQRSVNFEGLEPLNAAALKAKSVSGQIVGGNLKVIESHVGTPDVLKFRNRLVMFEEIGERGYRVDRMLFHLDQAKAFRGCKAVLFGTFTSAEEPGPSPSTVPWVLERWAAEQSFPVYRGLPCGHDTVQRVLPLGTSAKLRLQKGLGHLEVATGVMK